MSSYEETYNNLYPYDNPVPILKRVMAAVVALAAYINDLEQVSDAEADYYYDGDNHTERLTWAGLVDTDAKAQTLLLFQPFIGKEDMTDAAIYSKLDTLVNAAYPHEE